MAAKPRRVPTSAVFAGAPATESLGHVAPNLLFATASRRIAAPSAGWIARSTRPSTAIPLATATAYGPATFTVTALGATTTAAITTATFTHFYLLAGLLWVASLSGLVMHFEMLGLHRTTPMKVCAIQLRKVLASSSISLTIN